MRTLTQRELNRALLARQLLLERGRMPLPKALERIGGIQAQYAPSMYIGLWSRLEGFRREGLTRALERRSVVQATLMRGTIHLVSAADYWPFEVGVREARRDSWLRGYRGRVTAEAVRAAARELERRLDGGPRSRAELLDGLDTTRFNGACMSLDLVRVPPRGPGSGAAPTSTRRPRTGSGRLPPRRRRRSSSSSAATYRASARPPPPTWPTGPGCRPRR
jgi:hypothetical protein